MEADPLFELCVDEEVLRVSAGLEPLRVPQPVPLPDFAVEEVVGVGVLTLTLALFTCDGRTLPAAVDDGTGVIEGLQSSCG